MICCAPSTTALIPDEQTLLTVVQHVDSSSPAPSAACRAGAWPRSAEITLPIQHCCTTDAGSLALASAPRIAAAPSAGADTAVRAPLNFPIGAARREAEWT
eukprot:402-Prymnesium_polylepis.1